MRAFPEVPPTSFFNAIADDASQCNTGWKQSCLERLYDGIWIIEDSLNHLQVIDAKNKKVLGIIRDLTDYIEPMRTRLLVQTPWGEAINRDLLLRQEFEIVADY